MKIESMIGWKSPSICGILYQSLLFSIVYYSSSLPLRICPYGIIFIIYFLSFHSNFATT